MRNGDIAASRQPPARFMLTCSFVVARTLPRRSTCDFSHAAGARLDRSARCARGSIQRGSMPRDRPGRATAHARSAARRFDAPGGTGRSPDRAAALRENRKSSAGTVPAAITGTNARKYE